MVECYGYPRIIGASSLNLKKILDSNLHSPERRLIDRKIEHADLNALVDIAAHNVPVDELIVRRLKKRRLQLRDQISQLESLLDPPEPA